MQPVVCKGGNTTSVASIVKYHCSLPDHYSSSSPVLQYTSVDVPKLLSALLTVCVDSGICCANAGSSHHQQNDQLGCTNHDSVIVAGGLSGNSAEQIECTAQLAAELRDRWRSW